MHVLYLYANNSSADQLAQSYLCADPEGGGQGVRPPSEKSQKYRVSLQYWS